MNRAMKQLIYSLFFLVVIGLITYGLFIWIRVEPTCFDGKFNGNETGIDCGGACKKICLDTVSDISIKSDNLIQVKDFDYDFIAQISNPNLTHGSGKVEYEVDFKDSIGNVIGTVPGTFSILPGQTRFILVSPVRLDEEATDAELIIKNANWLQVVEDLNPNIVSFEDRRKEYIVLNEENVFSRVDGIIFNNSDFDFNLAQVIVVLFDDQGKMLAAGTTNIRTFLSKTESFYQVNWFEPFEGEVARIEVQGITNAFDNLNFLRRFGGDEQFQRL